MIVIKKLIQAFLMFSVYYILFIGVLYLLQERLIFNPDTKKSDITAAQKIVPQMKEVHYYLPNGKKLYGWFLEPEKNNKVVIFYHGNSRNLERNLNQLSYFKKQKVGVFMPEYEGFGGIEGPVSQGGFEQDAQASILWLIDKGYRAKDIIIYGHSLGTYVAVHIAKFMAESQIPVSAVVLEAPPYSIELIAKKRFLGLVPVSLLLKDKFLTFSKIKDIHAPLFIGHGKKDKVVPYEQGLKLFEAAKQEKTFFSSDLADHNSLPQNGFIDFVFDLLKK